MIYLFFLASVFTFMGKTLADISSIESHWASSWLGKNFSKPSFFGPKSHTSHRKDKMGTWISTHLKLPLKIANYLSHTILVPLTDIWHLANMLRRIGIYSAIFLAFQIEGYNIYLLTGGYIASNMIGFWLFYNYIFKRSKLN